MSEDLIRELHKLRKVAVRAEMTEAPAWLSRHLAELRKHERERPWPLGRCMACWADHKRLREAVGSIGGGFPFCHEHLDEIHTEAA